MVITSLQTVLCWLEGLIQHPATQEVTHMEEQNPKLAQIEARTGCHVTLQFAEKSNPAIRKDIASMFIALLEGREITQAKK